MASSSGKRTSSSGRTRKSTTSSRNRQAQRSAQDSELFHEIGLIVLFVAMLILFCCNFGIIGPVGNAISGVLFGIFGFTAYIAPVVIFLAVAFWFANEGNPTAVRKMIAGVVLFLMIGVVCDLITKTAGSMEQYDIKLLYTNCSTGKKGGGILAGRFIVTRRSLFSMLTIVMLVWMLSIMNNSGIDGFEAGIWQQVIYRMTDGLCCFYVLWVQLNQKENLSLQRELDGIRFMWQQQERQYEITSDTIENINRKCHDLKYQIHNLSDITDETEKREYLQELERDIMIYDVSLQTGNRALDVVLMEKGLFCKNHEIQWSCMVDGSRMNFMKAEDIYGIFGNALDNAIEAVSRLEDPQQRVISVKAIYQKKILVIQFQNYYQGDLEFRNGIPRTTKQNKQDHGYGMKSIRYTVEKYNGTVTVSTKNNIFTLQILIPLA